MEVTMSTLMCENLFPGNGVEMGIEAQQPKSMKNVSLDEDCCVGQDAVYIIRKRAMILDLWNLVPENSPEKTPPKKRNYSVKLPVLCDNSMNYISSVLEKPIPVQ